MCDKDNIYSYLLLFHPVDWLYFMRWRTTQTHTDLPVCKTFSKPVLCSPLIRAVPLVPCIISGFREKAAAVDPTMGHHIVATSSDATDRRSLSQPVGLRSSDLFSAVKDKHKSVPGVKSTVHDEKGNLLSSFLCSSLSKVHPVNISGLHLLSLQQHPSISASLAPPACGKYAKNTVCALQQTERLHTQFTRF